jgi:hypothetical protein
LFGSKTTLDCLRGEGGGGVRKKEKSKFPLLTSKTTLDGLNGEGEGILSTTYVTVAGNK